MQSTPSLRQSIGGLHLTLVLFSGGRSVQSNNIGSRCYGRTPCQHQGITKDRTAINILTRLPIITGVLTPAHAQANMNTTAQCVIRSAKHHWRGMTGERPLSHRSFLLNWTPMLTPQVWVAGCVTGVMCHEAGRDSRNPNAPLMCGVFASHYNSSHLHLTQERRAFWQQWLTSRN